LVSRSRKFALRAYKIFGAIIATNVNILFLRRRNKFIVTALNSDAFFASKSVHFFHNQMDFQRKMLEDLMTPLIPSTIKDWKDPDVCKHYLVKFCPCELFSNTKVDLGKCTLVHDPKLQQAYQKQNDHSFGYEEEFYEYLQQIVNDAERLRKKQFQRLEYKSDSVFDNIDTVMEEVWILEEQVAPHVPTILELGEEGKVAEAMDFYLQLIKIQKELDEARQGDPSHPFYRPDKRIDICNVCGSLLAQDTTGARIDQHMVGKQHTGYLKVREALMDHIVFTD
jgi:hypothetical protein